MGTMLQVHIPVVGILGINKYKASVFSLESDIPNSDSFTILGLIGPGTRCFPYLWVHDKSAIPLHPGTQ